MRIGIDVDGVLSDLANAIMPYLNQQLGTAFTVEDMVDYRFLANQMGSEKDLLDLMDWTYKIRVVQPLEADLALKFCDLRALGHEITVISKRTLPSHPAVVEWLHDQNLLYDSLVFVSYGNKLSYPIDVLFDDHPRMVQDAVDYPDKHIFLRNQPWNRSLALLSDNITRVDGFSDFITLVRRNFKGQEHSDDGPSN